MEPTMTRVITLLLLLAWAAPAAAQEREIREANLPEALEARLLALYDGEGHRADGPWTIGPGHVVAGPIAAMGGPLRVVGRVEGDLTMLNGDVIVESGGVVTGNVVVVGGEIRMADDAVVGGTITSYGPATGRPWDWRRPREERTGERYEPRVRHPQQGYSRFTVRTGVGYNRVEGLPILFGPVFQTAGPTPLRFEALGIWRTASGASLETDRMGYRVRAEQFLAPERRLSVGATVYSMVDPLDRWQIRDLEASLAAALFGQDFRDHYERTGWDLFAGFRPMGGVNGRVTVREERNTALPAGDPWALFGGARDWRLQPLVAEGRVRSVEGSVEVDRRDRRDEPRSGWIAHVSAERPVSGHLTRPALEAVSPSARPGGQPVAGFIPATPWDLGFTRALLDVRRYSPVGHRSNLNLRMVAGGSVTDTPLPPQYQHALGGPGTLPGFETFHGDCGARHATGLRDGDRFFPAYGCDRFALGQVEYRGRLGFDVGFGEPRYRRHHDWWRDVRFDSGPSWALFLNAGRGWAFADPVTGDPERRDTGTLVDAGLGVLLGKLGVYAALPLNSDVDQSPRFFLRWGSRF
jgi:hypothetical protein